MSHIDSDQVDTQVRFLAQRLEIRAGSHAGDGIPQGGANQAYEREVVQDSQIPQVVFRREGFSSKGLAVGNRFIGCYREDGTDRYDKYLPNPIALDLELLSTPRATFVFDSYHDRDGRSYTVVASSPKHVPGCPIQVRGASDFGILGRHTSGLGWAS